MATRNHERRSPSDPPRHGAREPGRLAARFHRGRRRLPPTRRGCGEVPTSPGVLMSNDPNTTRLDDMINDLHDDLDMTLKRYGLDYYTEALIDELETRGAFDPERD